MEFGWCVFACHDYNYWVDGGSQYVHQFPHDCNSYTTNPTPDHESTSEPYHKGTFPSANNFVADLFPNPFSNYLLTNQHHSYPKPDDSSTIWVADYSHSDVWSESNHPPTNKPHSPTKPHRRSAHHSPANNPHPSLIWASHNQSSKHSHHNSTNNPCTECPDDST